MDKTTLVGCIVLGFILAPIALILLQFAVGILLVCLGVLVNIICLPVTIPREMRRKKRERLNQAARGASLKSAEEFYFPYNEDGTPKQ